MSPSVAPPRPSRRSWLMLAIMVSVIWGGSQAVGWWRQERAAQAVQAHARAGDIVMFTTDTCPYCERARQWLQAHSVPWQECNVERHAPCALLYQSRGSPGVPLMRVKGQWSLGFDPVWVGEALQASP